MALSSGVVAAISHLRPRCSRGNPRFGSLGSDDGGTFAVDLPLGVLVMEHVMSGGVCWWSGVLSTASIAAGLFDVVLRRLGGGCVLMDARRASSKAGPARSMH